MNRTILFDKEAREKVLKGVNVMADAVSVTLGAAGRNVLVSRNEVIDYGLRSLPIRVTKDGVTVAREVRLNDPIENIGAMMLLESAEKTVLQAGDGTTTTIVLARAFVEEGMKMIDAGANPMELKIAIDKAVEYVVDEIKKQAVSVDDDLEKIHQIATVSANNDASIGTLVAHAFAKIGKDGIISIEEAKSVDTTVKIVDGFELKTGYISPFFITDRAKGICELTEPNIMLYEKSINNLKDIENVLRESIETRRPILIICEDCNGDALSTLIMNHVEKRIPPVCIVRVPYFTDNKLEVMEDIAACTGATYLTDSKGVGIDRATIEHLGKAAKVTVSKDSTVIIGGYKNKEEHEHLLNDLQMNKVSAQGEEEKAVIERRIARLKGGIAVIYVGGPTETEMKERVDRVDDAVRAVKAANEEGYVAGGGTVFLNITNSISSGMFGDNKNGWALTMPALMAPIKQMIKNAGLSNANETIKQVDEAPGRNVGFNAKTGQVEDLMEAGIIDPVKVLRCSLQNAASVAGMILTSQCIICDTLN